MINNDLFNIFAQHAKNGLVTIMSQNNTYKAVISVKPKSIEVNSVHRDAESKSFQLFFISYFSCKIIDGKACQFTFGETGQTFTISENEKQRIQKTTEEDIQIIVNELKLNGLIFSRDEVTNEPIKINQTISNNYFVNKSMFIYIRTVYDYVVLLQNVDFDKETVTIREAKVMSFPNFAVVDKSSEPKELTFTQFMNLGDWGFYSSKTENYSRIFKWFIKQQTPQQLHKVEQILDNYSYSILNSNKKHE